MSVERTRRSESHPSEPIVGSSPVAGPEATTGREESTARRSHDATSTDVETTLLDVSQQQEEQRVLEFSSRHVSHVQDTLYGHVACLHTAVCDCLLEHFYSSAAVVFADALATASRMSSSTRSGGYPSRVTPRHQIGTLHGADASSSSRTRSPFARQGGSSPVLLNSAAPLAGSSLRGSNAGRRSTPGPRATSAAPPPPSTIRSLTAERRRCEERRVALLRGGTGVDSAAVGSRDDTGTSNADLMSVSTSDRNAHHHVGGSSGASSSRVSAGGGDVASKTRRDGLSVLYSAPFVHHRAVAQQRSPVARRTSPVRSNSSAKRPLSQKGEHPPPPDLHAAATSDAERKAAIKRPASAQRRDVSPMSKVFRPPVLRTASRSRSSPLRHDATAAEEAAGAARGPAASLGPRSPSAVDRRDSLPESASQRRPSSNTARSSSAPRRPSPSVVSARTLRPLSPQKQAAQLLSTPDIFSHSAELRKQLKSVPMRSNSLPRVATLASAATQRAAAAAAAVERVLDSARRSSSAAATGGENCGVPPTRVPESPRTQPNTARRSSSEGTGGNSRTASPRHQRQPLGKLTPRSGVVALANTTTANSSAGAGGRSSSSSTALVVSASDYAEQVLRCRVNRSLEVDLVLEPGRSGGLEVNDLILELDGKSMSTLESLRAHFDQLYHGGTHLPSHRSSSSSGAAGSQVLPSCVSVSVLRGTDFLVVDVPLPTDSTLLLSGGAPVGVSASCNEKATIGSSTIRDDKGRGSSGPRSSSTSAQPSRAAVPVDATTAGKEEIQVE